jgi:signal transduction histidine kinase
MVLFNLTGNSIKYADSKKSHSFVQINSSNSDGHYIIDVTDNGIGIDPRNQDKAFDMFHRASEQSAGSGLGLYIVKETVNALKGSIDVRSKKSEGTTFLVQLNNYSVKKT